MEDPATAPENIRLPDSPKIEPTAATSPRILRSPPKFPRPQTPPRSASPESSLFPASSITGQFPVRPRSPLAKASAKAPTTTSPSQSSLSAPLIQRAHSSPGFDGSGRYIVTATNPIRRSSSPLSAGRRRSPLRSAVEEPYPGTPSWSGLNIDPAIPEHAELDIPPNTAPITMHSIPITSISETDLLHSSPMTSIHFATPRSRRRPSSPLHQSASTPSFSTNMLGHVYHTVPPLTSASASNSPLFGAQRFVSEPYPNYSFLSTSASSMPSTPTSLRSRSPSISSLDTIEDSPDAEMEALRLEEEERARRAMGSGDGSEGEDSDGSAPRRRSSLEMRSAFGTSKEKRKRWSVCGAERRADFSLEVIEE